MAYTTPRTWVAAETVDEDHLNEQIRDNIIYLKAETDKIDDVSFTDATSSRAIDGTIYQNTSGKIKFVTVNIEVSSGDTEDIVCYTDSASSPTIIVCRVGSFNAAGGAMRFLATFIVQVNHYYKVTSGGNPSLTDWMEWDIL